MEKEKQLSAVFKALGDETRLKIVELLFKGELCACKILENFNVTQPTLSYHMKALCESGIVRAERRGAWIWYSVDPEILAMAKDFFTAQVLAAQEAEGCCK